MGLIYLSPVSVIPPVLHTHLQLHIALTRRRIWELYKSSALTEIGERWTRKILSLFLVLKGLMGSLKSVNMPVNQ